MAYEKNVPKTKKKTEYVNSKDFYQALVEYQKTEEKIITPYICACIILICNKLSNKPCFNLYSFKEDMIADAYEKCFENLGKFDVNYEAQNPFAYFTQVAWNAFIQRINREKKQIYIKHKNFDVQFFTDDVFNEGDIRWHSHNGSPIGIGSTSGAYEAHNKIIEDFEKKQLTAKKKNDKKKK